MSKISELLNKHRNLTEAKLSSKDVSKMIKAIKDEDKKELLKYMAMDKKNVFSKRNLDSLVDGGKLSAEDAKKIGKLSIGVAHALDAMTADKDMRKKKLAMAMDRVKEVE